MGLRGCPAASRRTREKPCNPCCKVLWGEVAGPPPRGVAISGGNGSPRNGHFGSKAREKRASSPARKGDARGPTPLPFKATGAGGNRPLGSLRGPDGDPGEVEGREGAARQAAGRLAGVQAGSSKTRRSWALNVVAGATSGSWVQNCCLSTAEKNSSSSPGAWGVKLGRRSRSTCQRGGAGA